MENEANDRPTDRPSAGWMRENCKSFTLIAISHWINMPLYRTLSAFFLFSLAKNQTFGCWFYGRAHMCENYCVHACESYTCFVARASSFSLSLFIWVSLKHWHCQEIYSVHTKRNEHCVLTHFPCTNLSFCVFFSFSLDSANWPGYCVWCLMVIWKMVKSVIRWHAHVTVATGRYGKWTEFMHFNEKVNFREDSTRWVYWFRDFT